MGIYRNRKLLDLAHKVNECQFRLPGCKGYSVDGCEPAHSNASQHGKALSQKSGDQWHCASCHDCHLYYDGGKMTRELAHRQFLAARKRTFELYESHGWLEKVGYNLTIGA